MSRSESVSTSPWPVSGITRRRDEPEARDVFVAVEPSAARASCGLRKAIATLPDAQGLAGIPVCEDTTRMEYAPGVPLRSRPVRLTIGTTLDQARTWIGNSLTKIGQSIDIISREARHPITRYPIACVWFLGAGATKGA